MSFQITWTIAPEQWENARAVWQENGPGSDYDLSYLPDYDLLNGYVQISAGGQDFFPGEGFYISGIDLAHGLIRVLGEGQFAQAPDGHAAVFNQADDALEITFTKQAGQVALGSNLEVARPLTVPLDDFLAGMAASLRAFAGQVQAHAPELLQWESFANLRPYAG